MSVIPSSVELVKFRKTLKNFCVEKSLKQIIREKIVAIPNYTNLRLDVELTNFLCNLVENGILKKGAGVDKKALVLELLTELFSLNVPEQQQVKSQIEYLFSNKMIKKIPFSKIIFGNLLGWIKKKFF